MRRRKMMFGQRRPRRRTGAGLVAVTALLVASGWFLWTSSELLTPPERVLADELAQDPTLPVVVPAELPPGYVFLGSGRKLVDAQGTVGLATWLYGPKPGAAAAPIVEVCVSRRGSGPTAGCSPEGLEVLTTAEDPQVDAVVTSLTSEIPDEVRASWETTELTSRWDRVSWVGRRPLFS